MASLLAQTQILSEITLPLAVFFGTLFAGYLLRRIVVSRLHHLTTKTVTQIDDIVVASVRKPFILWFLILGAYFALETAKLPENLVRHIDQGLLILGIFSIAMALASIASRAIKAYSSKVEAVLPVASLTRNITSIVIFIAAGLIVLNSLGVSITPILATLGVGGLAVALALQDTLANLFSGFHIAASRQIRIGDFIKLESGEEGYVIDINWRTTKIRMLPNNVVLIPNTKLSQSIVTNYYLPDKELAVLVNLGVHYKSDLARVERVTVEVARQVMKEVAGGVPGFEPFVRYGAFGDSSINLSVIMRGKEYTDQYLIKHEFIKRLHERYAREGITIPYPMRTITYEGEPNR